ncbi:MAG: hypothetical protein WED10_14660 [Brumimicrobium sp.]
MRKITTLEIIQNLRQEGLDLSNLSENKIIRIEKTLKSRIKLDQSLDINELEVIIHLLRTQAHNLELFLHEDFDPVRKMIQNKDYIIFNKESLQKVKTNGQDLKIFLGEFFFEELISYARRCFNNHHYRALYSFLNIQSILSPKIVDNIRKQMEQRFLLFSETFRLHANKKPDKVYPLMNPYFYRCINLLNRDAVFEDRIMNFQNLLIDKDNEVTSRVSIRLIFSLTHYSPIGESNKRVIDQNYKYSVSEGAYERRDRNPNPNFKGDSVCNYRSKSGFNWNSISILIVPAVIVFFIVFKNNSNSREPKIFKVNQHILNQFQDTVHKSFGRKKWKNTYEDDLFNDYLPDKQTIQYLQFENPEVTKVIPYSKHRDYVFSSSPDKATTKKNFLQLMNVTSDKVILILQNQKGDSAFVLLRPYQMIDVSFELSKLKVYTGKELVEIVYLDEKDSTKHGLRFNKFNKSHQKIFRKTFTFKNINEEKFHSIQLFIDNDNENESGVEVRHEVKLHYQM